MTSKNLSQGRNNSRLALQILPPICGIIALAGCYEVEKRDPPLTPPTPPIDANISPTIDSKGRISSEELDIDGRWYVYGDAYGNPKSCMDMGKHVEEDCSSVSFPDVHLPELGFSNHEGKMCVSGLVAKLLTCCKEDTSTGEGGGASTTGGECTGTNEINCTEILDHSSMWGAGIGFDFRLPRPQETLRDFNAFKNREAWDSSQYDIEGISFDLQWHSSEEKFPLRIEFPTLYKQSITLPLQDSGDDLKSRGTLRAIDDQNFQEIRGGEVMDANYSTEEHPYGSPFWQKDDAESWARSPVKRGHNSIYWDQIYAPPEDISPYMPVFEKGAFTGDGLLGVQFHVVPDRDGEKSTPFSFCISNLKFLKKRATSSTE